jgi:hypothetical protein
VIECLVGDVRQNVNAANECDRVVDDQPVAPDVREVGNRPLCRLLVLPKDSLGMRSGSLHFRFNLSIKFANGRKLLIIKNDIECTLETSPGCLALPVLRLWVPPLFGEGHGQGYP